MLNNGMMKIRQEESKRKKEAERLTNVTLPSIKGTASSGQRPRIPTIEEKVAEQMRSATKPTQSQRITNVGTRINGAMPTSMLTPAQRDARNTETLHNTATSGSFRFASGVAEGLSPFRAKAETEKEKQIQDIRNSSGAYKAGKVVGELGSFAIPYAGAAGKVGKVVSKVPQVAKMGTVGQNVAKSIATDLAIGAPLNVNYAFNKEGLRGKEAVKSIAMNTGIDLVLGGAIEVASPAVKKFAKDLSERLGRTVTDEEAKGILEARKESTSPNGNDISEYKFNDEGAFEPKFFVIQNKYTGETPKATHSPDFENISLSAANAREIISGAPNSSAIKEKYKEIFIPKKGIEVKGLTFAGQPYTVDANKKILGKLIGYSDFSAEKLAVLDDLENVISNGRYVGSSEYIKHGEKPKETIRFDYFETPLKIDGENYIIAFDVEAFPSRNNYKTHRAIKEIDLFPANHADVGPEPTALKAETSLNSNIANLNVNPSTQNVNTSSPKIEPLLPPQEMARREMEALGAKPIAEPAVAKPILPAEEMVERQMKGKKPLKEMNKAEQLYAKNVDNLYGAGRVDEGVKVLTSNMRKARATADYILRNGMVDMSGKDISHKRPDGSSVSLQRIFEEAAQYDLDAFNDYLLHRHNIDRARQGKNVFNKVDSNQSRQIVNDLLTQYPAFKQLGEEVSDINEQLIDEWMAKPGLITKELGEKLKKMYRNYVPTYRETPETLKDMRKEGIKERTVKANKMINTAVGGDKPVIATNISIPAQTSKAIRAARMNEIALELMKAIKKNPDYLKNVARMAEDSAEGRVEETIAKNMFEEMESKGIGGIDDAADRMLGVEETSGNYYLIAMDKGKPVRMIINKDIFDALDTLNKVKDEETASKIVNFMNETLSQPFKSVVTGYNPFFGIRNILRDIPTAYIQGTEHNPLKFIGNQAAAYKDIFTGADRWKQYQALGGKRSGYFATQGGLAADKGLADDAKNFFRKLLDGIAFFNETTEAATRYAEFRGTLKRAGKLKDPMYDDLQRALYNSGEVTVNFDRHGDVIKTVDKVVPYLNPAVQGIDKFLRTMTTSPAAWAKGLTTLTIPSIALYEYNQKFHKEDYDKLDDRTKDNYYVFYIPDSDGKFIKIPKSRESGVLFQALAERLLRMNAGDKDAFKNFGSTVSTNFAPQNPIENNILAPLAYNLPNNKDFAGRTIVPQRLEGYNKSEQYDERTSELAKWLGSAAAKLGINDGEGLSPKQIDYIIDSYTGIIGDILIPATTQGGDVVKKVVTGPFTVDNVYSNSIQNDFYEGMEKAEKEKNHVNLQDDVNPDWKTPEEYRYSVYTKAQKEMGELRKIERKYQQLPPSETRDLYLRELRKQINSIAETATSEADKLTSEYQRNYIPALSDMNEKKQTYYRENLKGLGVDPAELRSVYDTLDLNGSGSISQDEAYTMLEQTNFSREQKAAIWNFINSSWKKNPYL